MATIVATAAERGLPPTAKRAMQLSVAEGCFALLPGTVTTGVFLTGFATLLGAGPMELGLVTAIPAFGTLAQVLSAWILARFGHRKFMCVWGASLGRYMWLAIACIPFTPLPHGVRMAVFLGLLGLAQMLGQMSGIAWSDWMADLVPAFVRGRYFGVRNAINAVVGMAVVAGGTRCLDLGRAHGLEARTFFWLFVVGGLGSLGSQIALQLQPEPGQARPRAEGSRGLAPFRAAFANRRFLATTGGLFAWTFMVGLTAPFNYAYALQGLHMDYRTVGLHAMISTGLVILGQPLWGRIIDRQGSPRAMVASMGLVALTPLLWALLAPGTLWPLVVDGLFNAIAWPGVALATSTLLMETSRPTDRAAHMAVLNGALGLANCTSALIGGLLVGALQGRLLHLGPVVLGGMAALYVAVALGRFACFLGMRAVPDPRPVLELDVRAAGVEVVVPGEAATVQVA